MKLSYILSIVAGIAIFSLLWLGLEFNVVLSLVFAVVGYFACTLIFKESTKAQEIIKFDTAEELTEYTAINSKAKSYIEKIGMINKQIDNDLIVAQVKCICDTSNKMLKSLKENPKKIKQVTKFVDYYLPFTLNILTQYNTIEDQRLTSSESREFMSKVEKMVIRVNEACEKQLNNLYEADLVNTRADIKVFETMLKADGLVDDKMNIVVDKKEGD